MTHTVLQLLDQAMVRAHRVLAGVSDDQRTARTPCPEFDVTGLAAHLISGLAWLAALPSGGTTNPAEVPQPDLTGRSLADEFAAAAQQVRTAWADDNLLAARFTVASTSVTGEDIIRFTVVEQIGHGWDIARATGQPTDGLDELADATLDIARGIDERILRSPGMMGQPAPEPDDASPAARLAAFLGRDPRWAA